MSAPRHEAEDASDFSGGNTRACPNRAVNAQNAPAIAQICHDLDGIPLAIELAAARVRVLSPVQISAGIGDRFRLLTGGARSAMPRQQTLRASVDWSHQLLSDQERLLFRRLAVFAGGWTLDAVDQVCEGDGIDGYAVLDLLTSLVDKSLVLADEGTVAVRYRMLETVREYALDLLRESGEHDALRERHGDFFLALAERVAPELVTVSQREWLELLDPEAANLGVAIGRAAETDPESALRLCFALTVWRKLRGRFAAAELAYARALDSALPAPSSLRAKALWGRAYLLTYAGDYATAIAAAQAALAVAEAVQDHSTMARALDVLGTIQIFPDPIGSRPMLERSIALAREAGDDWCRVDATQILGYSHLVCDEFGEAERLLNEVWPIIERTGYGEFAAWHWFGLSYPHLVRVEPDRLLELAERTIATAAAVGEPVTAAFAHAIIAWLDTAQGRPETAFARLQHDALRARAERQLRLWLPQTLDALAEVAAGLDSHEEAARLLGAAERARTDHGLVRWPPDQLCLRALEDATRGEMGDDAFAAARADGGTLSLEEAIAWIRRARGSRKRPRAGWESLTPTEVQVVELVTQGLTNPQIGERMFISRATVKVHLAHIFQKIDVTSRSELTAQAVRREGTSPKSL